MVRSLLIAVVLVSSCAPPKVAEPIHASPVRSARPADDAVIVRDLALTSRTPLVNHDAWLIAGFWESGDYINFSAIGFDNYVHEHDFARKDDPLKLARVQKHVSEYLSHGDWQPLTSLERKTAENGNVYWEKGSFGAVANVDGKVSLFENGRPAGLTPYFHVPRMEMCGKTFDVEVTGVAIDLVTKWVWATYKPAAGVVLAPCAGLHLAITFQAWNSNLYPYLLEKAPL